MTRLFSFPIPWCEPVDLFAGIESAPWSFFFDSADRAHRDAHYSIILTAPFETLEVWGDRIVITEDGRALAQYGDPFTLLGGRLALHAGRFADETRDFFTGGAAGFFGYELARHVETLPHPPPSSFPDLAVALYDRAIVFDHAAGLAACHIHAADESTARAAFEALLAFPPRNMETESSNADIFWRSNFTRPAYESALRKVVDYIRAGDIFQANIAQAFTAPLPSGFAPFAHYRSLRAVNPAPFAAYLNLGQGRIIASASPEQFLSVKNGRVVTRPIKGTTPRHADPATDAAAARALTASEKDRAENIMIVDLMRNDLSRVCTDASVAVTQLCALESFATVHHLVSTVNGTLRAHKTALDLLRACFPGGSITGAPKIRAMEIIAEIEQRRRGPYCGAIGLLGHEGAASLNIAIRTLVYEDGHVTFHAGGGVTVASDPAAEYQETLDKAAAIFQSFSA